jgi:hypothetical protein
VSCKQKPMVKIAFVKLDLHNLFLLLFSQSFLADSPKM